MIRRVSTILILVSLLFALMALTALGAKSPNENRRVVDPASIRVVEYAFPDEHNFMPSTGETYDQSLDRSKKSPEVAGWPAGDTYYDYQHNSTMGRHIDVGSSATCPWTVHLAWMFLPGTALIDREIVYNGWDGAGGSAVGYYDGLQNPGDYAGYNSLAVTDDNRFVVACHNNQGSGYRIHTFFQFQCNVPFHSANMRIPDTLNDCGNTNLANPSDAEVVWPKVSSESARWRPRDSYHR
jgi:hypothetical protein